MPPVQYTRLTTLGNVNLKVQYKHNSLRLNIN